MMSRLKILFILFYSVVFFEGYSAVKLPAIVSSNMVLQRNTTITIWGWADAGEKVTVKFSWLGNSVSTVANVKGDWSLKVITTNSKEPQTIAIKSDESDILLENVLFGEVWLCSGQSNMTMSVRGNTGQPVYGSQQAIVHAHNENLRLFTVERQASLEPNTDVDAYRGWQSANPENVSTFSAVAWFFGQQLQEILDVPVGMIHTSWGGSLIEAWMSAESLGEVKKFSMEGVDLNRGNRFPTVLFNAMINPVIPYSIKGTLWYQGEANASRPDEYKLLFSSMVKDWRARWGIGDFPFYFVQIAPFMYSKDNRLDDKMNSAFMREAQMQCVDLIPNSGIAVTTDIGDDLLIHPPEKKKVADRLLYNALNLTYGEKAIDYAGPAYDSMEIKDDGIYLSFKHADEGLYPLNELSGFEVAGADKVFYPAEASVYRGRQVVVTSEEVKNPVAVRYGWRNYTEGTLFDTFMLPASSFRTDNWSDAKQAQNDNHPECLGLQSERLNSETPSCGERKFVGFWDEIPASPSTAMPEKILDEYWHSQFQRVNREVADSEGTEIIFFGNSITWSWTLGPKTGLSVWESEYARFNPINMGNSGDITPVMLYRATHGNLDFPKDKQPKVAVLLCGTNNFVVSQSAGGAVQWGLGPDCPPEDVANGVRAIAQVFRRRLPETKVIMMGILPVSNTVKWKKCQQVNANGAALVHNEREVVFMDLQDRFLLPDGSLNMQLFTDGTHLTEEGYSVWASSLDSIISASMNEVPIDPVKIMLIGGSITEGRNSSCSYRRYLDGMLRREGFIIDFVGSRSRHNNNKTEPDNYQYDTDHEGYWGKNSGWLAGNMQHILNQNSPDIAVIQTGVEDIKACDGDADSLTDQVIVNIDRMIRSLRLKNKKVKIVLSNIVPVYGKTTAAEEMNQKIAGYTKTHSTVDSPIILADQHSGFGPGSDLTGTWLLPSETGARKLAKVYADAVKSLILSDQKIK